METKNINPAANAQNEDKKKKVAETLKKSAGYVGAAGGGAAAVVAAEAIAKDDPHKDDVEEAANTANQANHHSPTAQAEQPEVTYVSDPNDIEIDPRDVEPVKPENSEVAQNEPQPVTGEPVVEVVVGPENPEIVLIEDPVNPDDVTTQLLAGDPAVTTPTEPEPEPSFPEEPSVADIDTPDEIDILDDMLG